VGTRHGNQESETFDQSANQKPAGCAAVTDYLRQMAAHGDVKKALQILSRAGAGNPPMAGDELVQASMKVVRRRGRARG
jgi:thioredoxin-like negative regulator of GroEL